MRGITVMRTRAGVVAAGVSAILAVLVAGCGAAETIAGGSASGSGSTESTSDIENTGSPTGASDSSDATSQPSAATPSTVTPTRDPSPKPVVGACRFLGKQDLYLASNDDRRVNCRQSHTAQTIFVRAWPRRLFDGTGTTVTGPMRTYARDKCQVTWRRYVGGTVTAREQSLLGWVLFVPDYGELTEGSNWFRCDVVNGFGTAGRAYELPRSVQGILAAGVPDSVNTCTRTVFQTKEATVDTTTFVPCTERHRQRAIGAYRVGTDAAKFPGTNALYDKMFNWCSPRVRVYLGYPTTWFSAITYPNAQSWRTGSRHGICFARTTN